MFAFVYFTTGETIMDKLLRLLYWILVKSFFRGSPGGSAFTR